MKSCKDCMHSIKSLLDDAFWCSEESDIHGDPLVDSSEAETCNAYQPREEK